MANEVARALLLIFGIRISRNIENNSYESPEKRAPDGIDCYQNNPLFEKSIKGKWTAIEMYCLLHSAWETREFFSPFFNIIHKIREQMVLLTRKNYKKCFQITTFK